MNQMRPGKQWKFADLSGKKFGRLTAIRRANEVGEPARWLCKCSCGTSDFITLAKHLVNGDTQSCGCLRREITGNRARIHGKSQTREFCIWQNMIARCTNKKHPAWKYYGGRGIKICKRWMRFENFFKDMGNCPPNLTIDRKNNDHGYKPSNCRWATRAEQVQNRRIYVSSLHSN